MTPYGRAMVELAYAARMFARAVVSAAEAATEASEEEADGYEARLALAECQEYLRVALSKAPGFAQVLDVSQSPSSHA